jgi:ADP-ribosylglycohydrolase
MWGAIIGDIVGSRFEFNRNNIKTKAFGALFDQKCRYTDDTVMTIATASALLDKNFQPDTIDYALAYQIFGNSYPNAGYGSFFRNWLKSADLTVNNSFGNGSAMRVSPIGWAFDTIKKTQEEAVQSCLYTHNHPEGIKGAQAVASAIFLARNRASKIEISKYITEHYGYNLNRTLDEIRPSYTFNATCQGSVPEAIIAFLEAEDFEDTIRGAISLGGDSDTIAAIAGSIAEAFFEIPTPIKNAAEKYLETNFCNCISLFHGRISHANSSSNSE